MVSAVHGTLLECDIPTKVFILHLNDEQLPSERFVIQDLDDTHLFIKSDMLETVKERYRLESGKNAGSKTGEEKNVTKKRRRKKPSNRRQTNSKKRKR